MPQEPDSASIMQRTIAMIKRNPIKFATTILVLLGAIPGAVAGAAYISTPRPWWFVQRSYIEERLQPVRMAQDRHDYAIEYLVQQQALEALKNAKSDMVKSPNQTTQNVIEQLEKSIRRRQDKLDKAGK